MPKTLPAKDRADRSTVGSEQNWLVQVRWTSSRLFCLLSEYPTKAIRDSSIATTRKPVHSTDAKTDRVAASIVRQCASSEAEVKSQCPAHGNHTPVRRTRCSTPADLVVSGTKPRATGCIRSV